MLVTLQTTLGGTHNLHWLLLFFPDATAGAMVEGQLLHLSAGVVWDMGRGVHLLPHQHPQRCHLPAYGVDRGECQLETVF